MLKSSFCKLNFISYICVNLFIFFAIFAIQVSKSFSIEPKLDFKEIVLGKKYMLRAKYFQKKKLIYLNLIKFLYKIKSISHNYYPIKVDVDRYTYIIIL